MFIPIIILGVILYFAFSGKNNSGIKFRSNSSAEEALKIRYVNGEIDEESFRKMREILNR